MAPLTRRELVARGAAAVAFGVGVGTLGACADERPRLRRREYGPLVRDPAGVIDLPRGFRYRVLSDPDTRLTNGAAVPGRPDGMAAFPGPRGTTLLVRNHELGGGAGTGDETPVEGRRPYERGAPGGTTLVVVDPRRRAVDGRVASCGTLANCAGGPTPWGTWLTCEETHADGHGHVFEVIPGAPQHPLTRVPIRAMGTFSHEAVGVDARTGIVYLTEDDYGAELPRTVARERAHDGAFLYRYVPDDRRPRPGALQRGGRLEVLALEEGVRELNADRYRPRQRFGVVWKRVGAEDPRDDAEETAGAVRFNRLEGACFAGGALWFDDTLGGERRLGQIFRYLPGPNRLELFLEGTDANRMENPDNLVVTPWGDLWFAENGVSAGGEVEDRIMGVTPEGRVYPFARNRLSEFAGPTFAPDGRTVFVNIQDAGLTLAVWGRFTTTSAALRRRLALAPPPPSLAPGVSGELTEAAMRWGMTPYEAAAYARLGVALA